MDEKKKIKLVYPTRAIQELQKIASNVPITSDPQDVSRWKRANQILKYIYSLEEKISILEESQF